MFPVLTVMYIKLARTEERDSMAEFGNAYANYTAEVPGFIPRLSRIFSEASNGSYHRGR
jgi:protein-S-isoprenylcysteine O-methyltransferase Ste14